MYPEFAIETIYVYKILKEMATIYARLKNQYIFKYHILFSASFYKIIEEDQRSDETELFSNLNINHISTETENKNIDLNLNWNINFKFQKQKNQVGYLIKVIQWKLDFLKLVN